MYRILCLSIPQLLLVLIAHRDGQAELTWVYRDILSAHRQLSIQY